jgi:serralysin
MCELCAAGWSVEGHDGAGNPVGAAPPYGTASVNYLGYDTNTADDDQDIDALIAGWRWTNTTSNILTYSFPDSAADFSYTLGSGAVFANQFSAAQQAAAEFVLGLVAGYADLVLQEIGDDPGEDNADGTLRFFDVTGINTAYGYYPNSGESGGDMAFRNGSYELPALGSYEGVTVAHELGHALGLKHGHDTSGPGAMTTDKDSMEYSVMTYRSFSGQSLTDLPFYVNSSGHYAQSFMMADIAALQRLYGANFDSNSGNTVYSFDAATGEFLIDGVRQGPSGYYSGSTFVQTNVAFRTIWDGNGVDTYDLSNFTTNLALDLTPGGYSDFDVGGNALRAQLNYGVAWNGSTWVYDANAIEYARGHLFNALQYNGDVRSLIENAFGGSGNDIIVGNAADNELRGNGGDDVLDGGDGNDILDGGMGSDTLSGGAGNDTITLGVGDVMTAGGAGRDIGGAGYDTAILSEGFIWNTGNWSWYGFEKVVGNTSANVIRGLDHSTDYDFSGGGGTDTLIGAGGNDTLSGGDGDDILTGNGGSDTFVFDLGLGDDRIEDFNALEDSLFFDHALWGGGVMDDATFLSTYVREDAGNVLVEFGLNVVRLIGLGNEDDLTGRLTFGDADLL